ncbi:MAG TPA: peptidylprolyl isomerase [Polyangiaceae bacterium]
MQPSKPVALGALVVVLVGFAVVATRAQRSRPSAPATAPASASASASAAPPLASASASATEPTDEVPAASEFASEGFDTLADGKRVPPLPDSAPQTVKFGVIQFTYQGAQFAPSSARSKDQAKSKALAAIAEAKRDFSAAVAKGDPGSAADKGRIPRGMLEPAAEYVLFTLPKGEISPEPVDTPRGYWILRRND